MALEDFLPFQEGQVLTASDLNELVDAIRNGSIFTDESITGELISSLGSRVTVLEAKVDALEAQIRLQFLRQQFITIVAQPSINLSKTPALDSEFLYLNGILLARDDEPTGVTGDYTISGSIITFTVAFAATILVGDRLNAIYQFEVGT